MDKAPPVGIFQSNGGLPDHMRGLTFRQYSLLTNEFPQIRSWHKFGNQKLNIAVASRVVGPYKIRMVETGLIARLSLEVFNGLRRATLTR